MKNRFGIVCWGLMLMATVTPVWALEPVGPASKTVLEALREREGAEPTAEDLVNALNGLTARVYQDGKYA